MSSSSSSKSNHQVQLLIIMTRMISIHLIKRSINSSSQLKINNNCPAKSNKTIKLKISNIRKKHTLRVTISSNSTRITSSMPKASK